MKFETKDKRGKIGVQKIVLEAHNDMDRKFLHELSEYFIDGMQCSEGPVVRVARLLVSMKAIKKPTKEEVVETTKKMMSPLPSHRT